MPRKQVELENFGISKLVYLYRCAREFSTRTTRKTLKPMLATVIRKRRGVNIRLKLNVGVKYNHRLRKKKIHEVTVQYMDRCTIHPVLKAVMRHRVRVVWKKNRTVEQVLTNRRAVARAPSMPCTCHQDGLPRNEGHVLARIAQCMEVNPFLHNGKNIPQSIYDPELPEVQQTVEQYLKAVMKEDLISTGERSWFEEYISEGGMARPGCTGMQACRLAAQLRHLVVVLVDRILHTEFSLAAISAVAVTIVVGVIVADLALFADVVEVGPIATWFMVVVIGVVDAVVALTVLVAVALVAAVVVVVVVVIAVCGMVDVGAVATRSTVVVMGVVDAVTAVTPAAVAFVLIFTSVVSAVLGAVVAVVLADNRSLKNQNEMDAIVSVRREVALFFIRLELMHVLMSWGTVFVIAVAGQVSGLSVMPSIDMEIDGAGQQHVRKTARYEPRDERFIVRERQFRQQYSNVYYMRLQLLRPVLKERVQSTWPGMRISNVLNLEEGVECAVIGTIYKHMQLKPSILDEYAKERSNVPLVTASKFVRDDDHLILEDESGRVKLVGDGVDVGGYVTGVVVGVLGRETGSGEFHVSALVEAGLAPQQPLNRTPAEEGGGPVSPKYVALVSGLNAGSDGGNPLLIQLLVDHLSGYLGGDEDQGQSAEVVRLVIAGDSVRLPTELLGGKPVVGRDQSRLTSPIKELDLALTELAASMPVDIMPGAKDPANFSLPQQPLHSCLFPGARQYSTFFSSPNPHHFEVDGVVFLGTSGQNVQDLYKFSVAEDRLALAEKTLRWRHLAPTCPDTLGCYPFTTSEPFVIDSCPHVYFIGNQPAFSSRLIKEPEGQQKDKIPAFGFHQAKAELVEVLRANILKASRKLTEDMASMPDRERCMNDLFRPWLDRFVVVYLDDILVFSRTLEEHQGYLRQVLEKLREANFKINAKKCDWAKTQVLYLGHVLDGDGVKPEDSKIATIRDWPTPRTLTELHSFLGLANYYRKFVRNFSTIAAPLRRLLRKETIWKWDKDCTSAMKKLKQALIKYPVLKVADPSLPFVVTTDASQYGIGAVLQQDDGNGYRPVEFMSTRMPSEKVATSTYERELYAFSQALDHWKHYLLGRHFKVYSDHETLRWLKTQAKMTPKLTRWAAEIDQYDFELKPLVVPRESWWKLNQDKLDKVYEFMASELEARQEAIREKERQLKKEEEKRKAKEAEEKALRKLKERQDFEERIGSIVGTKINDACELFLGKSDAMRASNVPEVLRTHDDIDRERLERQIEILRREYEAVKKNMEELTRSIRLSGNAMKRTGVGVCVTSPPEAPARGRAKIIGVDTPTSDDFQKLIKAYNSVKEGKRLADMEVQALKDKFERVVSRLVRQGRTPRSNLAKRMNEATDDEELDVHGHQEEGLDDLSLRPSPPRRTSGRLASKAAATEKADFIKETKKYLKRLKKQGLQTLCSKEGVTFVTCEQAVNELAELRTSLAFDLRPQQKTDQRAPDSEVEEAKEDDHEAVDVQATQRVDIEDDEPIGHE
ncbi:hypothetical protein CBR_g63079 [Chara braunii]|uniref:Reverse transcriptase domain-containing protein n=1 Tax=Chara braunii TaxID=69332 RepID=A0A388K8Z3_CHABU|nr:hypothetical protein CBR_g63079 [Chara braunii]|eukprot:GBG66496.1 hypothetical protein CBR_g63079 [Chara braunii]